MKESETSRLAVLWRGVASRRSSVTIGPCFLIGADAGGKLKERGRGRKIFSYVCGCVGDILYHHTPRRGPVLCIAQSNLKLASVSVFGWCAGLKGWSSPGRSQALAARLSCLLRMLSVHGAHTERRRLVSRPAGPVRIGRLRESTQMGVKSWAFVV